MPRQSNRTTRVPGPHISDDRHMASLPLAQGHVQSDIHPGLRQLLEDQGLATKDIEDGVRAAPADAGTACGGTPTNNPKDRSR